MFENKIKFKYVGKYKDYLKDVLPIPAKTNVPDWFKKLEHNAEKGFTAKGCMPFLDTLTSGYLLRMPQDYKIYHNFLNEETNERDAKFMIAHPLATSRQESINLNDSSVNAHPPRQLKGSPLLKKNKDLAVHKINNPIMIETPPGYSCLFVPPLNNGDDRFEIIPGIVDTDTYNKEINFPFLVNGDKYPVLESVIERGTPYVQVIPFKRESWKMKIVEIEEEEKKMQDFNFHKKIMHNYKIFYWSKKKWN